MDVEFEVGWEQVGVQQSSRQKGISAGLVKTQHGQIRRIVRFPEGMGALHRFQVYTAAPTGTALDEQVRPGAHKAVEQVIESHNVADLGQAALAGWVHGL